MWKDPLGYIPEDKAKSLRGNVTRNSLTSPTTFTKKTYCQNLLHCQFFGEFLVKKTRLRKYKSSFRKEFCLIVRITNFRYSDLHDRKHVRSSLTKKSTRV